MARAIAHLTACRIFMNVGYDLHSTLTSHQRRANACHINRPGGMQSPPFEQLPLHSPEPLLLKSDETLAAHPHSPKSVGPYNHHHSTRPIHKKQQRPRPQEQQHERRFRSYENMPRCRLVEVRHNLQLLPHAHIKAAADADENAGRDGFKAAPLVPAMITWTSSPTTAAAAAAAAGAAASTLAAAAAAATASTVAAARAVSQGHLTRTTGVMGAAACTPAYIFRSPTSALVSAEGSNRLASSMCRMGLTRGCSLWDHGKIEEEGGGPGIKY